MQVQGILMWYRKEKFNHQLVQFKNVVLNQNSEKVEWLSDFTFQNAFQCHFSLKDLKPREINN